jgi:4-diphosphocytidyl-2-C-methyl-D-erythritol kinase
LLYFPNAKINIGLNILSKREDSYHNIESVFFPIPLKDVLEIIPATKFEFTYSGVKNIEGTHLCEKAYNLLKAKYDFSPVKCHLHKAIPIGGGIGGGSADASFMLKALNSFFNLKISNARLKEFALEIGSDCPFFIDNTAKHVTGRGEIMEEVNLSLKGYYLVLINKRIHISTKEAYLGLSIQEKENTSLKQIIGNTPVSEWKDHIKNDFEDSIFKKYPEIENIKADLYHKGALYASMSGTGSTVYGIFKNEINLEDFPSNYFKFQVEL